MSVYSLSDSRDLTGRDRMKRKTMTGSRIARTMHTFGQLVVSLNKHMIVPRMTKHIMAKVPLPTPKTRPS